MITSAAHPLWLVGFRPLFLLTMLAGVVLPPWWVALWTGAVSPAPTWGLAPLQWHAHEMFFGFGGAVLGGFLLTASKNWLGLRGHHGATLMALAAAWCLARVAVMVGDGSVGWRVAAVLYPLALSALLVRDLVRHRANDSFPDNGYFILGLPFLPVADWLLLGADWRLGSGLALAVFRLALLLILERTLTQFMAGVFQVRIWRARWLDHGIKSLALALFAAPWLPAQLAAVLELALAALLLARFAGWYPQRALQRIDIGIMHVAYLALSLHLLAEGLGVWLTLPWVGSAALHLFTVGALGTAVPAMLVRVSKGHTGRKVAFDAGDKATLWLALMALVSRVLAPSLWPDAYSLWLWLAALAWSVGFGRSLWRLGPYLLAARIDGREH